MKISILIGSPRKKDCFNLSKLIEANINLNTKDIFYEYIFLNDYNIKDCCGCELCFKRSETLCPFKDDLLSLKEKLVSSDGIVVATPVYAYQVPAPLKKFIDRLSFLFHRPELINIPTILLVSSDGGGHKQVNRYMTMTLTGWGCNLIGSLNVISPMFFKERGKSSAWGFDANYHKKISKEINSLSQSFCSEINNSKNKTPSFYQLFMFNCLRSKTFTSKADFDFWKEKNWLDADYFYKIKLNPFKKLFSKSFKLIINMAGKRLKNNVNTKSAASNT